MNSDESGIASTPIDPAPAAAAQLREQVRKLVSMKETGPKSAAWHRERVRMIWRLHRQLDQVRSQKERISEKSGSNCE